MKGSWSYIVRINNCLSRAVLYLWITSRAAHGKPIKIFITIRNLVEPHLNGKNNNNNNNQANKKTNKQKTQPNKPIICRVRLFVSHYSTFHCNTHILLFWYRTVECLCHASCHRNKEYLDLEGTHQDRVQLPAPHRTAPKAPKTRRRRFPVPTHTYGGITFILAPVTAGFCDW